MHNLFDRHTGWTDEPCYYVVGFFGFRRVWIAGPYRTRSMADDMLPRAIHWALHESGDNNADRYEYHVVEHHHGHDRSILGETQP